jgi:hypothetical protein
MNLLISNLKKQKYGVFLIRAVTFFLGSLCGVITDLVLFQLLIALGLNGFFSNIISSGVAVTLTYFLVTRFSLYVAPQFISYLVFIIWYTFSILCFSWLIHIMISHTKILPIICKIISLPFSFTVNFLFNNFIIRRIGVHKK